MATKYPKPKIICIDAPTKSASTLSQAGYNAVNGSFGEPRTVKQAPDYQPVVWSYALPNLEEQEVIIASTFYQERIRPYEDPKLAHRIEAFWQSAENGLIDPRPLVMKRRKTHFDRILSIGGLFLVFVSRPDICTYFHGYSKPFGEYEFAYKDEISSWGFLSVFNLFTAHATNGSEIELMPGVPQALATILRPALDGAAFSCSFEVDQTAAAQWTVLARNKFGKCVAGLYSPAASGTILLLPHHVSEPENMILRLVEEWLPTRNPKMFPFNEATHWIRERRYEPPRVVQLRDAIAGERLRADTEIAKLGAEIDKELAKYENDRILLTGTGPELVAAVLAAFGELGFIKLIDVDANATAEEKSRGLREDIQAHDVDPVLVIDVKGVGGTPTDDDARQSEKHALMRVHEWSTHNVKPLTIINHQRFLPPHARSEAYRTELINAAKQTRLGLMTTVDLWHLLRSFRQHGWKPEQVRALFYSVGRITPIPTHYKYVGEIVHVWKERKAFGIIPEGKITDKAKIAIEHEFEFEEREIASLEIDNKGVSEASAGSRCGIALTQDASNIRKRQRVYLLDA